MCCPFKCGSPLQSGSLSSGQCRHAEAMQSRSERTERTEGKEGDKGRVPTLLMGVVIAEFIAGRDVEFGGVTTDVS